MKTKQNILCFFAIFYAAVAQAQLSVTVASPKLGSQKALVELKMRNGFSEAVESARAICFLLDNNGKMVGQSAKWVIGGAKSRLVLKPSQEAYFNFVITSAQPFATTNLTAKVSFTRIVLAGEKLADPKDVQIQDAGR